MQIKRIYEPAEISDGYRVLVDRPWPRGVKKETARIDLWLKDVAPSAALRKWFGHKPEKWKDFSLGYREELKQNKAVAELIKIIKGHPSRTLLYGAKDEIHNQTVVLKSFLEARL